MLPPEPVRAYAPWHRGATLSLLGAAWLVLLGAGVPVALDLLDPGGERAPLSFLVRLLLFGSALPAALGLVLRQLARARVAVEGARVVVETQGDRLEIPLASIAALAPWRLPWTLPGFDLVLRSGRRLGIAAPAPAALAARIAAAAGIPAPSLRAAPARSLLHHPLLKLVLAPALVIFILFRLHAVITYGGLFGERHLFGWGRWLRTLSGVALHVGAHLAILGAWLRTGVELCALPFPRARPALEAAAALAFYGGVAAVLALRLL